MPAVSIIIPIYNTEQYLADCLESVLAQTFADFEAIVVDDGSTDGSAEIIRKYANRDSRFVSVHQENKGLSDARNAGIDIARGNWITFVDSDDVIQPQFLETLLDIANKAGADIACCNKRNFANISENTQSTSSSSNKVIELAPEDALANALFQKDNPDYSAWNKLYDASLWKERRFPSGKFFEDVATIPQVFLESRKVVFTQKQLYLYRKRTTSILATAYSRKKAELLNIAESVCTLVQGKGRKLEKAAQSNLLSASFSILMRTPDTEEFADYRERAWKHIKRLRIKAIFSFSNRFRNKIAVLLSFCGKKKLNSVLRRHV